MKVHRITVPDLDGFAPNGKIRFAFWVMILASLFLAGMLAVMGAGWWIIAILLVGGLVILPVCTYLINMRSREERYRRTAEQRTT